MKRASDTPPSFNGSKWRDTHQATVDSILGPKVRSIRSQGSQFYNKDNWTARTFIGALCEWARLNKHRKPDINDVMGWILAANRSIVNDYQKGIVIASTPEDLPKGLSFALVGGGYHESWHTKWSRRTPITVDEVWPKVQKMWDLLPFDPAKGKFGWSTLTGPLLEWSNIIEDIRIERLGCQVYPGSVEKMEALQDLILDMEDEGRSASEHRGLPTNNDLAVVVGVFRDVGLGYETPKQKAAISGYKTRSIGGWNFVMEGPLKPMLDQSILLTAEETLGSLWLAMEVVAAIAKTVSNPPPKKQPKPPKGEEKPQKEENKPAAAPKNAQVKQPELPDPDEEEEEETEAVEAKLPEMSEDDKKKMKLILYKVGDRATLKAGPYAGREVEVIRAGLPAPDGVQELEFALVEPD